MKNKHLQELNDLKKKYENLIKTKGKQILGEVFIEFFEANPDIEALQWTQCTPVWNDGEPCEFRVNEFSYLTKSFSNPDEDEGNFISPYTYFSDKNSKEAKLDEKYTTSIYKLYKNIVNEDLFLAVFGNGTRVTVSYTNSKIVIETEEFCGE